MASVWAARLHGARSFQRIVAIKAMLPELADQAEYRTMFLDEARVASKLRHPNICETFDLGEEPDGSLFMAMEWIEGASLQRLYRSSPISPEIAARVIASACAGLHAAHEATDDDGSPLAIVHRDASPHNILVSVDGHVKVTDFGVAQARGQQHATAAGQAKGKLAYMAPEQLRPGSSIDRRADVFALGSVLYEITTGRKPFDADTDVDVMRAILLRAPVRPTEIVPGFPAELERIIMRAMAKDENARFASAEGLRLALDRWLNGKVTDREIAALVRDRCGDEIQTRRAKLQEKEEALVVETKPTTPKKDRGRQLTVALGVLVVLFGIGSVVRQSILSPAEMPIAPPPGVTTSHVVTAIEPAKTAHPIPPPAPVPPAPIAVRIEPSDAHLVVDGDPAEVQDGLAKIERPRAGEMRVLLVKAPGHVDRLLVLEPTSPDNVEVVLESETPEPLTVR